MASIQLRQRRSTDMVSRLNILAGLSITFGRNGLKVVVPKGFRDPLKQVDAEQHVCGPQRQSRMSTRRRLNENKQAHLT
jgi:hypothetical protein